ncbi:hypothetical protein [Streptomyces sp. CB03238]|uniref:hypothetical protein n=1 Tax=Streptomyces sp. CB03238 TaxID=1907777 RepID=UPI000A11AE91|nr:hypothetical protein [Streptomyces sp. CB03238]ORT58419.1 hypothetical protein BKD26_17525 [Streptomyces sp. CB03238]
MSADRQVSALLKQIATQDVVVVTNEFSHAGRTATLAHVVEHYGFEYAEARREGRNKQTLAVYLYRDPAPEARAREAATIAAHPQAGMGGTVPGLQPGTLKPTPEAAEAVARLRDRIGFDVMTQMAAARQMGFAWFCVAALVVTLLICEMYVGALAGGAALAAFLVGGVKIGGLRRQRIAERLQAAGFTPVQDETGRQRFLRPGQRLPGHANPFAT